jgi:hypothetical protein
LIFGGIIKLNGGCVWHDFLTVLTV